MITVENILTNKERRELIKYSKPYLVSSPYGETQIPDKQTYPINVDAQKEFRPILSKIVVRICAELKQDVQMDKVWINCNTGKKLYWHNHSDTNIAAVYYMRTLPFLKMGTSFKLKSGKDLLTRGSQNSLLIFQGNLFHSVPLYPIPFRRYTMAMNLNPLPFWMVQ